MDMFDYFNKVCNYKLLSSIFWAYLRSGASATYQVKKTGETEYKPAAKAALKKTASYVDAQRKKQKAAAERAEKEAQLEISREAVLALAKKIKITEDASLQPAKLIRLGDIDPITIGGLRAAKSGEDGKILRIRVQGRVHRLAKQGGILFVTLRRGLDMMQCLLTGDLAKTYDALTLTKETSMEITGELWAVPEGSHAPLNRELRADYFRIIAKAVGGDESFTNMVPEDADPSTLLNLRHLSLRQEKASAIFYVRDVLECAFNSAYKELGMKKVCPPALVQTQVEGGATLFSFDYYGETAYLTQTSQLYLETILPSLGDVYCIEKSFRAEKSLTRRHVSGCCDYFNGKVTTNDSEAC